MIIFCRIVYRKITKNQNKKKFVQFEKLNLCIHVHVDVDTVKYILKYCAGE